jgi:hypothetical protein
MRQTRFVLGLILAWAISISSAFAQNAMPVITMHDAATATGNGTALDTSSSTSALIGAAGIQITGVFSGTITFEVTYDRSNWVAVMATNANDDVRSTTATTTGAYSVLLNGAVQVRARISSYSSGSITIKGRLTGGLISRASSAGSGVGGGSGDVVGPASSTPNALSRFSGTGGKTIKNSPITLGDSGELAGVGTLNGHTIQGGTSTFALYTNKLSVFAATSSTELAGILSDETGSSGGFMRATSPAGTNFTINQASDSDVALKSVRATDTSPTGDFLRFRNASDSSTLFAVDVTGSLTAGDVPAARLSGTIADARFPSILPALNGSALTNLNASNLASGTVPLARLVGITNAEISGSAAIAYSKLNLTGSIVNGDLAGSIANNKLANSSITIAGTSTALGASISQDTITGLSSTGLIKRTAANTLAIAVSGTDYAPATSGSSILYGNGSGGFSNVTVGSGLDFTGGTLIATGGGSSLPVADTTSIVEGSADNTKEVRIEADGITAGNVRVWTAPDSNTTIPIFSQIITFTGPTAARTVTLPDAAFTAARTDAAQTFTGNQTITPTGTVQDALRVNHSNGTARVQLGTYSGSTTFGGIWLGSVTPSDTNWALISAGSGDLYVNTAGSTGALIFRAQNTSQAQFDFSANNLRLGSGMQYTISSGSDGTAAAAVGWARDSGALWRATDGSTGVGNVGLGTSAVAVGTSGAGVLVFALSTEPSTSPTDTAQLYSKDFGAGDHRLYLRNEASSAGSPVASLGDAQTWTGIQTYGSGIARMTSPRITTSILDTNGNSLVDLTATGSAINRLTIKNSATGNAVELGTESSSDTAVRLKLTPKGGSYPNGSVVEVPFGSRYDDPGIQWPSLPGYGIHQNPGGGWFSINANNIALGAGGAQGGAAAFVGMLANSQLVWSGTTTTIIDDANTSTYLILGRRAAANLRFGAPDTDLNSDIVAQTFSVQGALTGGTSDQAGKDFTFDGSRSKGNLAGGGWVFRVTSPGSTGNSLNSLATTLTLAGDAAKTATFAGVLVAGSGPTTLTDSTGKILSAALNTVAVGQGGTGATTLTGVLKGNGTSAFTAATAGTDYTSPSSTETFTNKTLDAEGTGNVITIPVKWWLPAAGCNNATAGPMWDLPTSNAPTAACVTGSNTQKGVFDFPDSDGDYTAQQTLRLPSDWSGAIDAHIKWLAAATSGDVVWQVQTACVADAETDDPSWNTASTVTDTAKGTTLQTNDASITGVTATGCAAGEILHLRILRNRTHASDSITGTVRLIGLELTLRRAI